MLGAIVHPYVQDVPGLQVAGLRQLLQESTRQPLGLSTGSVAVFEELCKETIGLCWDAGITPCCCAAIAVLWLALAPERFPLQADTFSRAAGTAGKKWSLILPSSARVSELTYVTIIVFFFRMLHGSTKVVVRAVAPLSANTNYKVAMSLGK